MENKDSYHHGDLRNALITAGLNILAAEGRDALTLRKVARAAGVSHAAPYRHFADKSSLFAAIAEEGFQKLAKFIQQAIDQYQDKPEQILVEAGWGYVQFALENPDHLRVMFSNTIGDYEDYPDLMTTSMSALGLLTQCIVIGQENNLIAPGDPFQLTLPTWAMVHGLAMLIVERKLPEMDCQSSTVMESFARQSLQTFINGLKYGLPAEDK